MSWWRRLRHRDRLEGELDRELRDHVERQMAEHVRAGLPEDEARRRARVEFGGLDQIREQCRDARGTRWIDETWQDLRFAVRLLAGQRSYTVVTVMVLGIGMAVTTQFFTMFEALTSRSLPIDAPERVVHISTRDGRARPAGVSYADFEDIRDAATSFGALAAYESTPAALAEDDRAPARLQRVFISADGLRLLAEAPVLGRDFRAADEQRGAPPVVLLAGHVWRDRYGGDRTVVGRTIRIDGEPAEVIGVMPDGFRFPRLADLWQPVSQVAGLADQPRDRRAFGMVGRLVDGASVARAGGRGGVDCRDPRPGPPGNPRRRPAPDGAGRRTVRRRRPERSDLVRLSLDRRPRPPHRLRERREPGADASRAAPPRNRGSARPGRRPVAPRSPTADREHGPGVPGRVRRWRPRHARSPGARQRHSRRG